MSPKPYPKYKDSGVEWLGEVPEHWKLSRLKRIFEIRKRIAGSDEYDVLSVTQRGLRVKDVDSNDGQLSSDYSKYQIVEPGEYAMNHMDLLTGYVGLSEQLGVTSPDYRVFGLRRRDYSSRYFLRILQNAYHMRLFFPFGQGSSQLGRWRLPTESFNEFIFPVPPVEEQIAIREFLDRETAKIDALIAEQEKLITLLSEKRQATISHAVTKGLNPNAKMKDSGVEWLGEVPEHWEFKRLKHIGRFKAGAGFPNEEQGVEGEALDFHKVNALGQAGPDGYILPSENTISHYTASRLGAFEFPQNTIIFAKIGAALLLGRIRLLKRSACIDNNLMGFVVHASTSFEFVRFFMSLIRFDLISNPGTVPSLNESQIANVEIGIPDFGEQQSIVEFLKQETARIDALNDEANRVIDLLKERRTALISAAVTGKIDVRGVIEAESVAA